MIDGAIALVPVPPVFSNRPEFEIDSTADEPQPDPAVVGDVPGSGRRDQELGDVTARVAQGHRRRRSRVREAVLSNVVVPPIVSPETVVVPLALSVCEPLVVAPDE